MYGRNLIHHILAFSVCVLALCSCRDSGHVYGLGWPEVSAEIDSLTAAIEKNITNNEAADSAEVLVDSLERISRGYPSEYGLDDRILFFRSGIASVRMDKGKSLGLLRSLEEKVDSASDPYLFNRILTRKWIVDSVSDHRMHIHLLRQIEFYEKIGDSVSLACDLIHLSLRYIDVGEDSDALRSSLRAGSILDNIGYHETAFKNKLNRAIIYDRLGDTTARNSLMRDILREDRYADNLKFTTAMLVNAYVYLRQPAFLHKAYAGVRDVGTLGSTVAIVESIIADDYAEREMNDSADLFALMAFDKIGLVRDYSFKATICNSMAAYHERRGDYRKVVDLMRGAREYEDSARLKAGPTETARIQYQLEIENEKIRSDKKRSETRLWFAVIVLSLIAVAGVVIIILLLKSARMRTRMLRAELEKQQSLQTAAASAISAAEKENRLREMADMIKKSKKEGKINDADADAIISSLKVNIIDSGDWNRFTEVFSMIDPGFDRQLLERFPTLSLKQVRMCQYIKIGLDTAQIARLLSVKPETVWQNRWRLKQKMGLDSDDSLTQLINSIGGSVPE